MSRPITDSDLEAATPLRQEILLTFKANGLHVPDELYLSLLLSPRDTLVPIARELGINTEAHA